MNLIHPFQGLTALAQRRTFLALLILTSFLMSTMAQLDGPLKTPESPFGIVSFELAGNPLRAQKILDAWGAQGQAYAGLSLGLDYLFLVTYSTTISLGCVLVAGRLASGAELFSSAGVLLAWAQAAAAMLDAVENYALIRLLLGAQQELWPALAWRCAVPKFAIIATGLVYLLVGGVMILMTRNRGQNKPTA